MKHSRKPNLYVLPLKDAVHPSWEDEQRRKNTVNHTEIRKQMDKLHSVSAAVFVATILLEICIWKFEAIAGTELGLAGTLALVVVSLIVGLVGGILFFLTASVEENVRRNLPSVYREDEEYV